jgi:hypothetical protein
MSATVDARWEQLEKTVADIFERNGRFLDTRLAPHDRSTFTLRVQLPDGVTYHSINLTESQLLNDDPMVLASRFFEEYLSCEREE